MFTSAHIGAAARFSDTKTETKSQRKPDLAARWECVTFSGVVLSNQRMFVGDGTTTPRDFSLEEAANANGEWFAIFENTGRNGEYLVLSDSFGFQPVYYSVDSRYGLIVATSAEAVEGIKHELGVGSAIDEVQLGLNIGTNHSWSATLNSDNVGIRGLKIMRPFEVLWISDDEFGFCAVDELVGGLPAGYEELLELGIDNATQQLKVLSETDVTDRRINLSGGKDSRLMLAMLSHARLTSNFTVRTVNPKTWHAANARDALMRDLLIADALRRHFGMPWSIEGKRVATPISPMESLKQWQKSRGSKNYRFNIQRKSIARVQPIVELRGASGECFRNFWSHYLKLLPNLDSIRNTTESFEDDALVAFEGIYSQPLFPEKLRKEMRESFVATLSGMGRNLFWEAADRHFTFYRNRCHFGTTISFMQEGAVPFFPLNQIAFVRAGEKLTPSERNAGAVFFDLIERLDPSLNDLEFDAEQWPEAFWDRAKRSRKENFHPTDPDDEVLLEYFNNEGKNTETINNASMSRADRTQVFGDKSFIYSMLRDLLDELENAQGGEFLKDKRLRSWILNLPEVNLGYASQQVSKLMSIWQILTASMPANLRIFKTGSLDEPHTTSKELERFIVHPAAGVSNLTGKLVPLLYRVEVREVDGTIETEILLDQAQDAKLEYAFYLKVDGKVSTTTDYSSSKKATFKLPTSGVQYWVQAFVRKSIGDRNPYIIHSAKFKLSHQVTE